jgi:tRNA U34 5-carboxymethylaminomethyl modifying enzyme MnmG/GidA
MEERHLLEVTRPESVGQARRIEGMTPKWGVAVASVCEWEAEGQEGGCFRGDVG